MHESIQMDSSNLRNRSMKQMVEWLAYAGFMILAVLGWIWVITAFFCAIMGGTGIIE